MRISLFLLFFFFANLCYSHEPFIFEPLEEGSSKFWWKKYQGVFGKNTIQIRFPETPVIEQTPTKITAYAYDWSNRYSLSAYYPPLENIDPFPFFEKIMEEVSEHPFSLIDYRITRPTFYWWILDYVLHDNEKKQLIKSRILVTKFNVYTLQCAIPYNTRDHFVYFSNSLSISEEKKS